MARADMAHANTANADVVVCGLGVMGCAALHQFASRGVRAIGIERFAPGHDRGSSHGETRIIRLGYFEHPSYVPLVRHAHAMWRDLEERTSQKLLHVTGIIEIGSPDSILIRGTLASATTHGLRHEVIGAGDLMRRYPAFRVPPDHVGVLQPDGGFLDVSACIRTLIARATDAGAQVRTHETIHAIEPHAGGVRVVTGHGVIEAAIAVVTAGPWLASLVPDLPMTLRATRQAMAWFETVELALFTPDRFPVFLIESAHGIHYGFPPFGTRGIKIAKHHHADETVEPDRYDRALSPHDEALIRSAVAECLPAANGRLLRAATCLYTMSPDGDFILDRLPMHPQIIVASPCSGHGFKFAPVIGEILADLAIRGETRHDISRFALSRF
jgi:sarcosine oxidase